MPIILGGYISYEDLLGYNSLQFGEIQTFRRKILRNLQSRRSSVARNKQKQAVRWARFELQGVAIQKSVLLTVTAVRISKATKECVLVKWHSIERFKAITHWGNPGSIPGHISGRRMSLGYVFFEHFSFSCKLFFHQLLHIHTILSPTLFSLETVSAVTKQANN
jgi:hypothetical protein